MCHWPDFGKTMRNIVITHVLLLSAATVTKVLRTEDNKKTKKTYQNWKQHEKSEAIVKCHYRHMQTAVGPHRSAAKWSSACWDGKGALCVANTKFQWPNERNTSSILDSENKKVLNRIPRFPTKRSVWINATSELFNGSSQTSFCSAQSCSSVPCTLCPHLYL